jgi:hypothetical protein
MKEQKLGHKTQQFALFNPKTPEESYRFYQPSVKKYEHAFQSRVSLHNAQVVEDTQKKFNEIEQTMKHTTGISVRPELKKSFDDLPNAATSSFAQVRPELKKSTSKNSTD